MWKIFSQKLSLRWLCITHDSCWISAMMPHLYLLLHLSCSNKNATLIAITLTFDIHQVLPFF